MFCKNVFWEFVYNSLRALLEDCTASGQASLRHGSRRSRYKAAANRAILWDTLQANTLQAETTTMFMHELALTFVWLVVNVGR